MTTHTKGPLPGTASNVSARPDHTPARVMTLRKALVLGALVALLVGVLSAAAATYLAGGQTDDELERRAQTLTGQVDTLTAQVDELTTQVDTLTAQTDSLAAENADLADTLAGAQAQVDSLGNENAALRTQVADMTGQQPVVAEVTYGALLKVDRYWTDGPPFVLVVDVTVTNPDADKDAYISSREFRLKGPDDTMYPLVERSRVAATYGCRSFLQRLPGGRLHLEQLTLGPSETVKASLAFYVPEPVTEFTITYPANWLGQGTSSALSL